MSDAPKYKIETIWDIAKIPIEARGRFLAEFPLILEHLDAMDERRVTFNMAFGADIGTLELKAPLWVDDGRQDLTVTVTDSEGGFSLSAKVTK